MSTDDRAGSHDASCLAAANADSLVKGSNAIGLGTLFLDREKVESTLREALAIGYRRIDCAPVYFNEDAVGDALANILNDDNNTLTRSDLTVVSKLAGPFHRGPDVKKACLKTLADLRLDHLDLYLVHWPVAFQSSVSVDWKARGYTDERIDDSGDGTLIDTTVSIHETWKAMEELVDQGLVRHIGVSNFPAMLLHELLTTARIPPVVNQCEGHIYLPQRNLLRYCQARNVHYQAYSPLGSPGFAQQDEPAVLQDAVLQEIAAQYSSGTTTPAQIALAWALQRGTSVVVKSGSAPHLQENWKAQDVRLTKQDMAAIDSCTTSHRYFRPEEWWPHMPVAVFD